MAFCSKCGATYTEGAAYCPQCGATLTGPAVASNVPLGAPTTTGGLKENVAGLLCYLLGWITGIIFLLIDKRPFVRFHAAQSIVVFGFLSILRMILLFAFLGAGLSSVFSFWALLRLLLGIVTFVAWVVLMVCAYQGKWTEVPGAAELAKNMAGSTRPIS